LIANYATQGVTPREFSVSKGASSFINNCSETRVTIQNTKLIT